MKELEIYGTMGPSCCTKEVIAKMLQAGMSGMRLNLSHCNLWDRKDWINAFHEACTSLKIKADLMIDMCGPELRIQDIQEAIELKENTEAVLNKRHLPAQIIEQVDVNDTILLDDGKIRLQVRAISEKEITCHIVYGGTLKPKKSIMIEGKTILGPTLTENDIKNLKEAKAYGVTAIMQPFVSFTEDLKTVKETLKELHAESLKIYAKIESKPGIDVLEHLLPYCDCIVIARGDLANACGLVELPKIQKKIERICHKYNHPYMVVTEMLNSMIENPTPTRAEVSDVFHAVYHGASSIMLTGETASGKYPVEAMNFFVQVAKKALENSEIEEEDYD